MLVGKGVCYDTGGINIKSANSMKTMKHDMAGSAVALGVLTALTEMKIPYDVECWLAVVENNVHMGISPSLSSLEGAAGNTATAIVGSAYRPDDVIKAVTGETIEIVHSDAEVSVGLSRYILAFHSFLYSIYSSLVS